MFAKRESLEQAPPILGAKARAHADTNTPLLDAAFLARLERLTLAVKRVRTGSVKGDRRSKRKGMSTDFADYRDYVQGDDLRHVDWNIFGRLDTLYLKLFQEYEDLTLYLILDVSRSMDFGSPRKIWFAKRLAAALGYIALSGNDRVLIECAGATLKRLEPLRGRGATRRFLSFLDSAEAKSSADLAESLHAFWMRNRKSGIVVLLTDLFDERWEETLRTLSASASDVYVVQVLAPEEITPQLTGDLRLIDSETNTAVEVSVTPSLLREYLEQRDDFLRTIRRACLSRGITHIPVSSATPVEELTLSILRQGGLLR